MTDPAELRGDLVPGVMRCAKCKFQLVRTTLYVRMGTTGPGSSETEPCPNGCGPLWPVTWKQWAEESKATAERFFEEAKAEREKAERLRASLRAFIEFQISDYHRSQDAARRYCEIRRKAKKAMRGES